MVNYQYLLRPTEEKMGFLKSIASAAMNKMAQDMERNARTVDRKVNEYERKNPGINTAKLDEARSKADNMRAVSQYAEDKVKDWEKQ